MEIIFPKNKFDCREKLAPLVSKLVATGRIPELPSRARAYTMQAWVKLLKKEAEKKKWKILHMRRRWKLPVHQGTLGYLWNDGDLIPVTITTVPLKPGYYIVTREGNLLRVIPNI